MRWGWMARSAWEATKPLPGALADEAPDGNERIPAELAAQIRPRSLGEMSMVAAPRAEAGRWQPRHDDPDDLDTYTDHTLTTMARQLEQLHRDVADLLLELADEKQRANAAEEKLAAAEARIRGLELTVAAQAGHPPAGHTPAGR